MVTRWYQRRSTLSTQQLLDAVAGNAAVLDREGVIVAVNDAWSAYSLAHGGSLASTGPGASYCDVCDRAGAAGSADGARVGSALRSILRGSATSHTSTYLCHDVGPAQWYTVRLASVGSGNRRLGVLVTHEDVSVHERTVLALELRASQDPLTGLGNRHALHTALTDALGHDRRVTGHAGVGLVYVDLDEFKPVNDTHGHAVGDEVLRSVARRLQELSRPGDTVARLGGDEFALCVPGMSADGLDGLSRRISAELARPHVVGHVTLGVPASVGSHLAVPGDDVEHSTHQADVAMYAVKRRRRSGTGSAGAPLHVAAVRSIGDRPGPLPAAPRLPEITTTPPIVTERN